MTNKIKRGFLFVLFVLIMTGCTNKIPQNEELVPKITYIQISYGDNNSSQKYMIKINKEKELVYVCEENKNQKTIRKESIITEEQLKEITDIVEETNACSIDGIKLKEEGKNPYCEKIVIRYEDETSINAEIINSSDPDFCIIFEKLRTYFEKM